MKWFRGWKKITRMKINLHSCGSVADILPDLIECGMDIFNPVQTSACGMDARTLKDQFGDRLVFYGGAYDAQTISREADYDAVYAIVTNTCGILKNPDALFSRGCTTSRVICRSIICLPYSRRGKTAGVIEQPKWNLARLYKEKDSELRF